MIPYFTLVIDYAEDLRQRRGRQLFCRRSASNYLDVGQPAQVMHPPILAMVPLPQWCITGVYLWGTPAPEVALTQQKKKKKLHFSLPVIVMAIRNL